jgi:hypothetical protein
MNEKTSTDTERIKLDRIKLEQLKKKLAIDFNIEENRIDDNFFRFVQTFIKSNCSPDEYIKRFEEYSTPSPSPNGVEIHYLLLPVIYYNVNIKLTTYVLLGLLLDLYLTKGATSAILGLLGLTGKSISKLHKENGEVCIYYRALTLRDEGSKTFGLQQLYQNLKGQDCQYPSFQCIWVNCSKCEMTFKGLEERCQSMKDSAIFSKTLINKWKIEL